MESAGFLPVLLLPHRTAPHIFQSFHRRGRKVKGWHELPSKIASSRFLTGSSWSSWPRSGREITSGAPLSVDRDDDKNPVVALREIADDTIELDHLQESLIRGMQKHVEMDEPEEAPELEQTLFGIA